jgi:hypothetical protein
MPTPRIPAGFKPVIQGYSIGAPDGVAMTEVGGGMPRVGLEWDRGKQQFQVTLVLKADAFAVWTAFFLHIIKKGSIQFDMPLDSGFGMEDHTCIMVPGSYSAARAGGQITSVTFAVLAESKAYDMTAEEAQSLVDLWDEAGGTSDALLDRLAEFVNEDLLVLVP